MGYSREEQLKNSMNIGMRIPMRKVAVGGGRGRFRHEGSKYEALGGRGERITFERC